MKKTLTLTITAAALLGTSMSVVAADITQKKALTLDGARKVVASAVAEARRLNTTAAIAVVDDGGNVLALERIDGTFPAGSNISIGKARTAALFQRESKIFEETINKGRASMIALSGGALEAFTPLQGGVPVMSGGQVVGAVGVSGAASAQQDEELATIAVKALDAPPARVSYFDHTKVDQAFAKGAVLFDEGQRYMVHASRREKPGMAEIHTADADIVHVLEGTSTLITGGTAMNVKETGPGELRGDSIQGGEEHHLAKGDVIIVPAGTPHWFKNTSNPFLYYVVKAR
jgi:uncharacterized protein GlcG (DUF336 family)